MSEFIDASELSQSARRSMRGWRGRVFAKRRGERGGWKLAFVGPVAEWRVPRLLKDGYREVRR